jgi:hypothetical protein
MQFSSKTNPEVQKILMLAYKKGIRLTIHYQSGPKWVVQGHIRKCRFTKQPHIAFFRGKRYKRTNPILTEKIVKIARTSLYEILFENT